MVTRARCELQRLLCSGKGDKVQAWPRASQGRSATGASVGGGGGWGGGALQAPQGPNENSPCELPVSLRSDI